MHCHRQKISAIAVTALFLGASLVGSAQSILRTAGDFTLLGGTAITSTGVVGTTIRNGNVGLSPGATSGITGFPPAVIVNGAIVATGGVTDQARLDLIRASVGLAGMASNANMSTVDLGGKTLAPGVYTFTGAASQTGALVLDAQGQNSVAWVFQIGTAFTSSINSTVTFINLGSNGGSDLGVFWNAGSAVNIGANNQLVGNYLAGTSIVLGGLTAGNGRALALAGVSLDTNTVNAHGGPGGADYTGGLRYAPSGAVVLSGGSGGTTVVSPGVADGGTGSFGGNVANSGTVSPGLTGGAPATLNVAGNFAQTSAGKLVIELASPSSFDRLAIAGTANLAGTVQIDTLNGYDPIGQTFTFLTAPGGVTGTFGTANGSAFTNRVAIAALLGYGPTSVAVTFTQLPFAGFATTSNQAVIANVAQASPVMTRGLNQLTQVSQFPVALNAISPQGYQVWSDFAFAHSNSLADRLLRDDHTAVSNDTFYFEGGQDRGRTHGDMNVASSRYSSTSAIVGGNRPFNPNTKIGAFFAFGKTSSGLGTAGSETIVKDRTLGLRAGWNHGPLFAEAILAYGFNRYESTRTIEFPGTSAIAATSTNHGTQWTTGMTVGQHLTSGRVTVSPFGGLLLSRWTANRFTEDGAGAFGAVVEKQTARSLRSQLGVEGRLQLGRLQPHLRAAWLHEFSDGTRDINASFGGGANFSVVTHRAPRDTAEYSAGVDFVLGPRALIYTDVYVQSGGTTEVINGWRLGVSINY